MNTQDQQSLTRLIDLLNSGANFYRQAENQTDNNRIASKFKYFVKAREISMQELEPYIAAISAQGEPSSVSAEFDNSGFGNRENDFETSDVKQERDVEQESIERLTFDEFEKMEGETLEALDQAIQISVSQSMRTLLSEIRGRTSACCYNLQQMRRAEG